MGNTPTHTHETTSHNASTPHPSTRPEPYRTHPQLARAERITPARQTIPQRARTQHPYPNPIPNRYDRHCQRSFDPDAAFQHLCQHTLHTTPTDQPYCIALDGTTVPAHRHLHPRRSRDTQPRPRPVRARTAPSPTLRDGRLAGRRPQRSLWARLLAAHLLPQRPLCPPHLASLRNRVFWVMAAPAGCVHACSKWQTSGGAVTAPPTFRQATLQNQISRVADLDVLL
jgi:hypothetical protein